MTAGPIRTRRRRRDLLLVAAAMLACLFVWLARRGERSTPGPVAQMPSSAPAPAPPRTWAPPAGGPHHAETTLAAGTARFIRDVYADGDDVCANEPITVTVTAVDDRPNPLPLYVKIGSSWGAQGVVSFGIPGSYEVSVSADDHRGAIESRTLPVKVRDCGADFQFVRIEPYAVASQPGVYGFTAHPVFARPECRSDAGRLDDKCAAAPPAGVTLRYYWEFGDSAQTATAEPYTEHDYSAREQDSIDSSYLVRVTVVAGQLELHGVTSVNLTNLAFQNKVNARTITPDAVADPAVKDGSAYRFSVRFFNHEKTALRLQRARAELIPCDAQATPDFYDLSASEVLDGVDLPPGPSATTGWLRGHLAGERYCRAVFTATGDGPGGMPISAVYGTATQPSSERRELSSDDPDAAAELARTLEALRLLGRDPNGGSVTAEEIRALEQKGLLK